MKTISLQMDEALLGRVDKARGDIPRQRWIARAVQAALDGSKSYMDKPVLPAEGRADAFRRATQRS